MTVHWRWIRRFTLQYRDVPSIGANNIARAYSTLFFYTNVCYLLRDLTLLIDILVQLAIRRSGQKLEPLKFLKDEDIEF